MKKFEWDKWIVVFVLVLIFAVCIYYFPWSRSSKYEHTPYRGKIKTTTQTSKQDNLTQTANRVVKELLDTEALQKLDVNYNQAYIDIVFWKLLNVEKKQFVSALLAQYCGDRGSTYRVTIYDYQSGKKLAEFSRAFGFTVY